MARYIIENIETKGIKKSLPKWGEIPISTEYLDGVIKIKNYRKYNWNEEVDVVFEGKIFVRINNENRKWYSSSILKTHRMNYFGINLKLYENIKKIKWL